MPEHGNWATIIKIKGIQWRFTRMIDDIGILPNTNTNTRSVTKTCGA